MADPPGVGMTHSRPSDAGRGSAERSGTDGHAPKPGSKVAKSAKTSTSSTRESKPAPGSSGSTVRSTYAAVASSSRKSVGSRRSTMDSNEAAERLRRSSSKSKAMDPPDSRKASSKRSTLVSPVTRLSRKPSDAPPRRRRRSSNQPGASHAAGGAASSAKPSQGAEGRRSSPTAPTDDGSDVMSMTSKVKSRQRKGGHGRTTGASRGRKAGGAPRSP